MAQMPRSVIDRLAVIESLPNEMQSYALVDWKTVAALGNFADVEHARNTLKAAGVPMTYISPRRCLPTWGDLRAFIESRKRSGQDHD
jgi:hypothetical protein